MLSPPTFDFSAALRRHANSQCFRCFSAGHLRCYAAIRHYDAAARCHTLLPDAALLLLLLAGMLLFHAHVIVSDADADFTLIAYGAMLPPRHA